MLSQLRKLTRPICIRGVELTARALTIADSKRMGRRFAHLDLVKVLGQAEVPGMPLVSTWPASRHALVATCVGYGGDPHQEAAVSNLTFDEQAEIVDASFDLTFKNLDLQILKEKRNGRKRIRLRGVQLEVRPLSPQMVMTLIGRFPDFACLLSEEAFSTDRLLDSSEPALNALIAAGLGFAGDPVEEEAASRLTMMEQAAIIVYMFGFSPDPAAPPPRLAS